MNPFDVRELNRCDYYILFWVIYYLQGILYPSGGIISVSILGVLLVVSLYHCAKVLRLEYNPIFFRGLSLLVLLFSIYGFILIFSNLDGFTYGYSRTKPTYFYIKQIYLSLLPIYSFYYFTKQGYLTEDRLRKWVYVYFFSVILSYIRNQRDTMLIVNDEEVTNNMGYLFLGLIPAVQLFKKQPVILYAGMFVIFLFILSGMKRGAIFIGIICIIFSMKDAFRELSLRKKVLIAILSISLIAAGISFAIHLYNTSAYFTSRFEQTLSGDASNRDKIYSYFWNAFAYESNPFQFVFGHGAYGTLKLRNVFAHNDWLEIAINQGLIGLFIYLYFFWTMYKNWKNTESKDARMVFAIMGITFFAKSLFSMSYEDLTFVESSLFGFYLAGTNMDTEEVIIIQNS